jgi:hypothetical protein
VQAKEDYFGAGSAGSPKSETSNRKKPVSRGWQLSWTERAAKEYARMGVLEEDSKWRMSEFNSKYKTCKTYPQVLAVPTSVTDDVLRKASEFRSKERLPVH